MIRVKPCGDHGSTVEFAGDSYTLAQEYAALTLRIADRDPEVLTLAQQIIETEVKLRNGEKADLHND